MVDNSERPSINISAIPVAGIGGLGMVGLVVIMAMAFPVARSLLAGGLAGGVLLALTLLFARRHRRLGAPRGDLPTSIFSGDTRLIEEASRPDEEAKMIVRQGHCLATC